jgi:hypothetical protein
MPLVIRPHEHRDAGALLRIFQASIGVLGRKAYDSNQTSA